MSQPALKLDQISLEPNLGIGTRTISARASDGSLLLSDALVSSGVTLSDMSGIRNIASVRVVGVSGSGAQYNTLQDAVDSIPADSRPPTDASPNPHIIIVTAGSYQGNTTISHDGVYVLGIGGVVLKATSPDATVKVLASVSETPKSLTLSGLIIRNSFDGEECILLSGGDASTVGQGLISIINCDLSAEGLATKQIHADTVGNVLIDGGNWSGSAASSLSLFTQCAKVEIRNVASGKSVQSSYNAALPVSVVPGSEFLLSGSSFSKTQIDLLGGGSARASGSSLGDLVVGGDQIIDLDMCKLNDATVNGSSQLHSSSSRRTGTLSGTGSAAEALQSGQAIFAGDTVISVALPIPAPDANYQVIPESSDAQFVGTANKTNAGFDLVFAAPATATVDYRVVRNM